MMEEKINEALDKILKNLTAEQLEKVKSCTSEDDVMKLLGEWNIDLPDEIAESVAGGFPKPFTKDWWHKLAERALKQGEVL